MKKLFKILLFLILLGFIGFVIGIFFTSDLSEIANSFFSEIKNGNYQKAGQYLSKNFKEATLIAELKEALPYEKFKNYSGCSFTSRVKNADGTAKLEGKIEFSDGSAMKVKISLIKENDQWKINHIVLPPSGIEQSGNNYDRLVHTTMLALIKGVISNNYSDFYALASENFKNQVPASKLSSVFSKFSSVDLDDLKNIKPVIREKKRLENGTFRIEGYYPTTPNNLGFRFEYSKSSENWEIEGVFLKFE